jgi:hypothetical protein
MKPVVLQQGMTILLLSVWCLITTGVGRLCLSGTAIRFVSQREQLFLSFGIGLVVTGYAVFLLGITQAFHNVTISIFLGFLGLIAVKGWLQMFPCHSSSPALPSPWDRPAAYVLGVVLLADLFLILTPEIGKDALIYHLAVPKLYLQHHGFYFIPGNIFAGYPLLGEMHYLLALFIQSDILAKAMHYAVLCGTLLGISLFIRSHLRENAFPALSMLVFFTIPSVFAVSHAAYNDLFVTLFTLAAVYSFLKWHKEKSNIFLILFAIFSGSAAASKYTALLLVPLGCLGILSIDFRQKTHALDALHHVMLYAAGAFIIGSPFYLKNWIVAGNPFYPFFYDIFGGRGWDADQARVYDLFIQNLGMGKGLIDYLLLPWNLSFQAKLDSPQFDGILGPVFFLTLPFLIGKRHWETPILVIIVYAFFTFLFWASSAQQIRYLIPLFPLLAIVTGAILTRYRNKKPIFGLLILILLGSAAFNGYHLFRDFIKVRPFDVAVGLESRDEFLTRMLPAYPMYRFVNQELPPESRVFLIYMKNFNYLCDRYCYSDAMFEAHTIQKILQYSQSPAEVRDRLKTYGFTYLLYDKAYLLNDLSPLSIEEKRLFLSFRESYVSLVRQSDNYRLDRLN